MRAYKTSSRTCSNDLRRGCNSLDAGRKGVYTTTKHRAHGEGSVYLIKDGRWVTSIAVGSGKRKYLYSKTQKEALAKLTKARYEQQQGTLVNSPRQSLKKILVYAQLPNIRFHDLRHSTATILLAMGVHPKIVQEILGHSSIAITLNMYSHVIPTMHEKTMDDLGNLFGGE